MEEVADRFCGDCTYSGVILGAGAYVVDTSNGFIRSKSNYMKL
jgi:hypothetical protein